MVIEAVFEDINIKHKVIKEVEEVRSSAVECCGIQSLLNPVCLVLIQVAQATDMYGKLELLRCRLQIAILSKCMGNLNFLL